MASGTRSGTQQQRARSIGAQAAPRWTGDDILREAAETFSLLPRPGAAAREAFLTLLTGYWPGASESTRLTVSNALRGSPRVSLQVLSTLDSLSGRSIAFEEETARQPSSGTPTVIARALDVSHRRGMRVTATVTGRVQQGGKFSSGEETAAPPRTIVAPPPLEGPSVAPAGTTPVVEPTEERAETAQENAARDGATHDRAAHARQVVAHLARDASTAAPELQPERIERVLEAASRPADALALLLDIEHARAAAVIAVPRARGTAVALRALGVAPVMAERLVARWRGRAPSGFRDTYAALSPGDCLDTVARWRREDAAAASELADRSEARSGA